MDVTDTAAIEEIVYVYENVDVMMMRKSWISMTKARKPKGKLLMTTAQVTGKTKTMREASPRQSW